MSNTFLTSVIAMETKKKRPEFTVMDDKNPISSFSLDSISDKVANKR